MELFYFFMPMIILHFTKVLFQTNKSLPPSPLSLPVIGHLHLLKPLLYRSLHTLSKKYAHTLFLWFGSQKVLVISSPSAAEECFTKNDIIFANRPLSLAGSYLSYNYTMIGWSSYGQHWRNVRRFTVNEIFFPRSLQISSTIRNEGVHFLVRKLFRRSGSRAEKVNLKNIFFELIFNVVMRMVAGKRCFEEDLDENKRQLELLKFTFSQGMIMNDLINESKREEKLLGDNSSREEANV